MCNRCLPTASALHIKRVVDNGHCPWCRNEIETDKHVLFTCNFARSVWYSAGLQHVIQGSGLESAAMILLCLFEVCNRDQCVSIAMISWSIWYRRNKWFWEKVNGSAFGVKNAAMHLLSDWQEAQSLPS